MELLFIMNYWTYNYNNNFVSAVILFFNDELCRENFCLYLSFQGYELVLSLSFSLLLSLFLSKFIYLVLCASRTNILIHLRVNFPGNFARLYKSAVFTPLPLRLNTKYFFFILLSFLFSTFFTISAKILLSCFLSISINLSLFLHTFYLKFSLF